MRMVFVTVFMKEEFHKMWHDTMDKLINSKTANIIGWVSGSKIIKSFATGNNPFSLLQILQETLGMHYYSQKSIIHSYLHLLLN